MAWYPTGNHRHRHRNRITPHSDLYPHPHTHLRRSSRHRIHRLFRPHTFCIPRIHTSHRIAQLAVAPPRRCTRQIALPCCHLRIQHPFSHRSQHQLRNPTPPRHQHLPHERPCRVFASAESCSIARTRPPSRCWCHHRVRSHDHLRLVAACAGHLRRRPRQRHHLESAPFARSSPPAPLTHRCHAQTASSPSATPGWELVQIACFASRAHSPAMQSVVWSTAERVTTLCHNRLWTSGS